MTSETKSEVTFKTPFRTKNQTVLAEWIDYNGHMNVAYYTLAFDKALDFFFEDVLDIGPSFVKKITRVLLLLKLAIIISASYWKESAFLLILVF